MNVYIKSEVIKQFNELILILHNNQNSKFCSFDHVKQYIQDIKNDAADLLKHYKIKKPPLVGAEYKRKNFPFEKTDLYFHVHKKKSGHVWYIIFKDYMNGFLIVGIMSGSDEIPIR